MAMKVELKEKPKNPTIIEGFPGFGFISTITTEYLLDHLDFKPIGRIWSDTMPPMAVIHKKKIQQPLEINYNKKHNLIIIEAMTGVKGIEWEIADALIKLYQDLNAKEIISIEGIGVPAGKENLTFYHTNQKEKE